MCLASSCSISLICAWNCKWFRNFERESDAGVVRSSRIYGGPSSSDLTASFKISIDLCTSCPRWLNVVRKNGFFGFCMMCFGSLMISSRSIFMCALALCRLQKCSALFSSSAFLVNTLVPLSPSAEQQLNSLVRS